ncbi:MAG: uroporphyrinogen-III synthase [Gaiellaceae bacterium]
MTRPATRADALIGRLEAAGHEVVLCPLIDVEPLGDDRVDTSGYDWVIVTSATGATELARRRTGSLSKLAVVGPGTAEAAHEAGLIVDLVPRVSTQEGLLAELPRPTGHVLLAAAEGARQLLVEELGADFLALYRTREFTPAEPPEGDLVVLASGSAARAFARLRVDLPCVAIGPQTTSVALEVGLRVVAEAGTHDLDGLVAAVGSAACSSPS